MKIALAQTNPLVGDLDGNRAKVLDAIEAAEVDGVDLVVFPELPLIGYPPRDLLGHDSFIDANLDALHAVAREVKETAAIVGYVGIVASGVHSGAAVQDTTPSLRIGTPVGLVLLG